MLAALKSLELAQVIGSRDALINDQHDSVEIGDTVRLTARTSPTDYEHRS